jgi:hypothetical protein
MRIPPLALGALLIAAALPAQSPAKAAPCDSASVLLTAKPIYGVGLATYANACPGFSAAIDRWFVLNADTVAHWTPAQIVAAIAHGARPSAPPPPPVVVSPPAQGNAPEPTTTSVVLHRDDFNRASVGDGYAKRGNFAAIDGHAGSAIRFSYGPGSDDNLIEKEFATTTDLYVRYWFRLSPGADPTCKGANPSGMKWFMLWRAAGNRYTMGVGNLGSGNPGLEFTSHDNGSTNEPNPFLQNKTKVLRFGTVNDGQWHKYTVHVVTGNGGYEQLWIDGTPILDNSANKYGHEAGGINMIQLPGAVVNVSGCAPFTIDLDDLVVWRDP